MKIEEYLTSLPESILSGEDVQLPEQAFREIFKFANLRKDDVFYHLGCGDGKGLVIAKEEFNVEKIIGIDISKEKTNDAIKLVKEKNHTEILFKKKNFKMLIITSLLLIINTIKRSN